MNSLPVERSQKIAMEILKPYRRRIDSLDDRIIELLAERFAVVREVGNLKFREQIPSVLRDRIDEVLERVAAQAAEKGISPDLVRQIYALLIEHSCDLEDQIMAELSTRQEALHPQAPAE